MINSTACRPLFATGMAALALTLSACGAGVTPTETPAGGSGDAAAGFPATVTNCGRELTVADAPERVVGMMPSQTEMLVRLGLTDRLVGQGQTTVHALPADVADQVSDVPELSADTPPAREDLLEVQPDAVVAPTMYEFTAEQGFATIEQLDQAGAVSYVATAGCADRRATGEVDDMLTDIDNLGQLMGVPQEAETLRTEYQSRLDAVGEAIDGAEKPKVAQLYIQGNSLSAIGAGIEYDIIKRAGGDNVFSPDEAIFADFFAATVSPEEVAARNPEAIVFSVSDAAHEKQVRAYLKKTFPTVKAVADDRLIAIPASDLFPGALGNVAAVETISAGLYPDRF